VKPLLLQLQAFGPFAATESIDFTALGNNPLFLINGPTGAGKSTLLDAICFALYGQTTGGEREPSQMRCDVAEPSVLTEVRLDFSLGTKQYRIRRVPQQDKPKTRGEGSTAHSPEAQLWELDGSEKGILLVARKVNDATGQIKELIGLDVEQFRQVMVLPQGKFRELLLADSSDREKIFSQLFQTQIYKRIEDFLKSKASGIKQDVERHQSEIRGILQVAELNSEAEIVEALNQLQPALAEAQQNRVAAQADKKASEQAQEKAQRLIQRFAVLGEKQGLLALKQAAAAAIDNSQKDLDRATNADAVKPLFDNARLASNVLAKIESQLGESSAQVAQAQQRLATSDQALELAREAATILTAHNKREVELQHLQQQSHELSSAQTTLAEADAASLSVVAQLENMRQQLLMLSTERERGEFAVEVLSRELEGVAEQQILLDRLTTQLGLRRELEVSRVQQQEKLAGEGTSRHAYQASADAFKSTETAAKKTELSWHAGQAALLARELQHGESCPVCGSREHPQPAAPDSELVDKTEVDQSRVLLGLARETMELDRQRWDQAINARELITAQCLRLARVLGPLAEAPLLLLQENQAECAAALASLLAKHDKRHLLQQRLELIKPEHAVLADELEALNRQLVSRNEDVVRVRTEVDRLTAVLPKDLREPGAISQSIDELRARIERLTVRLAAAEQGHIDARSNSDKSSSRHQALEQQHYEQQQLLAECNSIWRASLESSLFTTEQDFHQALLEQQQQQILQADINSYHSELNALKGVVEQIQAEVAGAAQPDMAAIDKVLAAQIARLNTADSVWQTLEQRHQQLAGIVDKLDCAHRENQALETQYGVIGTLSEVANGQTGNKISLQRFVLSVLLDDVLIQASQRLNVMSKGRYRLLRKEDRAKGNKASGLELEVEDSYSGKTRPVATLSGGESFLAALALALGLSDVVQSYAGGIKLDTLFIDEGFGSLDSESLDLALRTLIDLQASGRTIGIISHVSELKEQMALRVDVIGERQGSRIAIVGC